VINPRHSILSTFLFSLLLLVTSGCIDDGGSSCVQYNVGIRLTDKSGDILPDSVAGSVKAYMFIGGKYSREVTSEPDGHYYISFDNSRTMQLVAIGAGTGDSVLLIPPTPGDDIGSVCARLKSSNAVAAKSNASQSRSTTVTEVTPMNYICYGSFSYEPGSTAKDSVMATLMMTNKNVRIHIVIRHLLSQMGPGHYTVRLDGFRNALAFDGTIKGDSVSYEPSGRFDTDGEYITDIINALPTFPGETVTFTLYKDGNRIFSSNKDDAGAAITLTPEDDKAIVVDVGHMGISLNIMPWSEVNNGTIFY
jgi:hypothetical protein